MSLDVVNNRLESLNGNGVYFQTESKLDRILEKWQNCPYSKISHHGETCCELAREWVFAMDFSQLNGADPLTGPRWIRHKYTWGPSRWEMFWCQAVREKTLDCGALASLAHSVFTNRGVKCFPVQLVQRFSREATAQWRHKWRCKDVSDYWIEDDLIYHEGCAVLTSGNEVKIWDPSAGWWVNSKQSGGYGGLAAIRVFADETAGQSKFKWEAHTLRPNVWEKLNRRAAKMAA